jgi:hypothetical protein
MLRRMAYRTLWVLAAALVFLPAATAHQVSISQQTAVGNGTNLEPGTYRVEVVKGQEAAEVKFFLRDNMVASVSATLTPEGEKCRATQVHTDVVDGANVITKIWLVGSRESLVFRQEGAKAD